MGKGGGGDSSPPTTTVVQPPRPPVPNEDLLTQVAANRINSGSRWLNSPYRTMDFLQGYQAPSMQLPNFTGMNMFGPQPYGINGTQPGQAGMPMWQGGGYSPMSNMPFMMGGWPMGGFGFGTPPMVPTQAGPGVVPGERLGGAGPRPGGRPWPGSTPAVGQVPGFTFGPGGRVDSGIVSGQPVPEGGTKT